MNYHAGDPNERILDLLDELQELLEQKDKQIALLERISKTQEETIASLKESIAIEAELQNKQIALLKLQKVWQNIKHAHGGLSEW